MKNWMKARQTKYAAYASVYILVILAVLAAAPDKFLKTVPTGVTYNAGTGDVTGASC